MPAYLEAEESRKHSALGTVQTRSPVQLVTAHSADGHGKLASGLAGSWQSPEKKSLLASTEEPVPVRDHS